MEEDDSALAVLVAVPSDAVAELEQLDIAHAVPTIRGPVLETVLQVGVGAATVVSLMQAPSTVRGFASWIVDIVRRDGDSIVVRGRRGGRSVDLRVTGNVDRQVVADFLTDSLGNDQAPPAV